MVFKLDNVNQTELVPQSVLAYNNASHYVSINASSGIVFYDTSSNITATIAWTGIETTNPNGFDIISPINMNSNGINNIYDISFNNGINITDNGGYIKSNNVDNLTIHYGNIILDGNLIITGDIDISLNININFNGFNSNNVGEINFINGINIFDESNNSQITSSNGGLLTLESVNDLVLNVNNNSIVELTPTTLTLTANGTGNLVVSSANSHFITNPSSYIDIKNDALINGTNNPAFGDETYDFNLDPINGLRFNYSNITAGENTTCSIAGSTDLTLTSSKGQINLNSYDNVNIYPGVNLFVKSNDSIFLNAPNDINLTSTNGNGNLSSFGVMSIQSTDDAINLTSASNIVLNAPNGSSSINMTAGNQVNITSMDGILNLTASNSNINLNALTDITIQSNGLGTINTNAPNSNSYGNALPICLNKFKNGTWSYTLGGQVFQDVFAGSPITIALPTQFFAESPTSGYTSTMWQINFDMNCWNFANAGDKGFAIYLSFIDNNANLYEPFLYNNLTPYCKWDNPPTFNGAFTQFKSINFCDYIDFTGLVGSNDSNIRLQMNIAGDSQFLNVAFKFKLGFTRIQSIN